MSRMYQRGESQARKPARLAPCLFLALMAALSLGVAACRGGADQSLKAASEAWDAEDYETAASEYERYLQSHPTGEKSLEARLQLANIYYLNLNRHEQARRHYVELINQEPSHPSAPLARERLAEVLAELGRSYEAIAEYENIAPSDESERRRIRLLIAELYFDQKNFNQAITEYSKVTERAPYDELSEQAYQREAAIYHISRGQYQQALPVYEKLVLQSSDPEVRRRALYGIVDCYAGLYQFDDAIKTLRDVREEGEQDYVRRRLAELERQKREAEQASTGLNR